MYLDGLDFPASLYCGFKYLFCKSFRNRKKREWANESSMFRIYEIGMWVTLPAVLFLLALLGILEHWR